MVSPLVYPLAPARSFVEVIGRAPRFQLVENLVLGPGKVHAQYVYVYLVHASCTHSDWHFYLYVLYIIWYLSDYIIILYLYVWYRVCVCACTYNIRISTNDLPFFAALTMRTWGHDHFACCHHFPRPGRTKNGRFFWWFSHGHGSWLGFSWKNIWNSWIASWTSWTYSWMRCSHPIDMLVMLGSSHFRFDMREGKLQLTSADNIKYNYKMIINVQWPQNKYTIWTRGMKVIIIGEIFEKRFYLFGDPAGDDDPIIWEPIAGFDCCLVLIRAWRRVNHPKLRPATAPDSLDIDGVPAAVIRVIDCFTVSADVFMFINVQWSKEH